MMESVKPAVRVESSFIYQSSNIVLEITTDFCFEGHFFCPRGSLQVKEKSLSDAKMFEDVGEDFWGSDGAFAAKDVCKVLDTEAEVF